MAAQTITNKQVYLILLLGLVLALAYWIIRANTQPVIPTNNEAVNPMPEITNTSGLTEAENELNSSDLNVIDSDLSQNDKDSSSF